MRGENGGEATEDARGVATASIARGSSIHVSTPMAQVLKAPAGQHCAECLAVVAGGRRFCGGR